jgi:predicted nucleic acid-binding protein
MNKVLVDSSVWIAFFKGAEEGRQLFSLLDTNQICINDLILAELIPSLNHKKELALVRLLQSIERTRLHIDWESIIEMQTINFKNGLNRVGVPDLIIAQNALQNDIPLFSFDRHFEIMKKSIGIKLFNINTI